MPMVTGGQLVARTLSSFGVTDIFGVHGGHLDSFLVECDELGMRIIDHRHEAAAGNAAEGYARATGGLGVAFATSGPGFANAFSSLCNAGADRTPVLLITSSPPLREAELNVLQGGLDQVAVGGVAAKWSHRVTTVARIPDLTALAVRHALTGVPGPVVLDIPIDIMFKEIDETLASKPSLTLPDPAAASATAVEAMVDVLARAERPVILTGGGAAMSRGCRAALEGLLDKVQIPVFGVSWGLGLLDPEHPCWAGNSADAAAVQFLAGSPDVVVLLGARQGAMTGSRTESIIPHDAMVIHVDLDGTQPGRIGEVAVSITADAAETVRALGAVASRLPGWGEWTRKVVEGANAHALLYADDERESEHGLHPYWACRSLVDALPPDAHLVFDGGETAGWISFFARGREPRSWFGLGSMGGLGVGQGMAIGAQVARPDRPVVLVTGDGGVGFHLQEFDTMIRHRLPITTVVLNNSGWGMSSHGQSALFGQGTSVAVELPDTRYDTIASSFGCHGEHVTSLAEVAPALHRALGSGRPACIDLRVSDRVTHPMMADLTADLPDGYTRIPYYEAIPHGEL
ncbi:thiamine pyrophosphate-binding protein [Gordonia rhizosphera]|uniref:acetolactate synthase n=1 Tax=Gordonia rhizosphera NBRC 16068 TaxID=1108045 RepID=K6WKH0_9ACTN|nr:thiamine pyrophosphate-binding protein [Gordonia rhizosphera]GAB92657.1 putative transferase [Gordonia rhizosphera NBRC 16068]